MKTIFPLLIPLLFCLAGCGDSPTDDYIDRLVLGTGLGHGVVTGISDVFVIKPESDGVLLHWALESKYDMGGGFMISILVEQKIGDAFVERQLIDYEPLDDTDIYYYIESFYHIHGTGTFRANAIVGFRKVASQEYTVRLE